MKPDGGEIFVSNFGNQHQYRDRNRKQRSRRRLAPRRPPHPRHRLRRQLAALCQQLQREHGRRLFHRRRPTRQHNPGRRWPRRPLAFSAKATSSSSPTLPLRRRRRHPHHQLLPPGGAQNRSTLHHAPRRQTPQRHRGKGFSDALISSLSDRRCPDVASHSRTS